MKNLKAIVGVVGLLMATSASAEYDSLLKERNERIAKKVEEEVGRQLDSMQRKTDILQNKLEEYRARSGSAAKVKAPWVFTTFNAWKEYLREQPEIDYLPEKQDEELSFRASHSWGHRAHDNTGSKQDMSCLVFGQPSFTFKEAFLPSTLLTAENSTTGVSEPQADIFETTTSTSSLPDVTKHYLHILADQVLTFEASCNRQTFDLSYERAFRDKRLSVRFTLPLVREEHRLELSKKAEITTENLALLTDAHAIPKFHTTYNKMQDFIEKVLASNGSALKKTQEEYGIGDMQVAGSYLCKVRYIDRTHVGAQVMLGTGRISRGTTVWQPELGNGGCTSVHLFGNASWHRGHYANPFIKLRLGYNFPIRVSRRVPQVVSSNSGYGTSRFIDKLGRRMPWSEVLSFHAANSFENKRETEMRHMAAGLQRVTMTKGVEAQLSIGNTCEQCFKRPITFGVCYDLFLREREKLSSLSDDATYAPDVVTRNTYRIGHTIQTSLGYRFSETCFFNSAFSYCFAGRNVPALFSLDANLTVRF